MRGRRRGVRGFQRGGLGAGRGVGRGQVGLPFGRGQDRVLVKVDTYSQGDRRVPGLQNNAQFQGQFNGNCNFCGAFGHKASFCPTRRTASPKGQPIWSNTVSFAGQRWCTFHNKYTNHDTDHCWELKKFMQQLGNRRPGNFLGAQGHDGADVSEQHHQDQGQPPSVNGDDAEYFMDDTTQNDSSVTNKTGFFFRKVSSFLGAAATTKDVVTFVDSGASEPAVSEAYFRARLAPHGVRPVALPRPIRIDTTMGQVLVRFGVHFSGVMHTHNGKNVRVVYRALLVPGRDMVPPLYSKSQMRRHGVNLDNVNGELVFQGLPDTPRVQLHEDNESDLWFVRLTSVRPEPPLPGGALSLSSSPIPVSSSRAASFSPRLTQSGSSRVTPFVTFADKVCALTSPLAIKHSGRSSTGLTSRHSVVRQSQSVRSSSTSPIPLSSRFSPLADSASTQTALPN